MATTIDRTTDIPLVAPVVEKFQYPGIPTTCDGAEAVVWVETRISQGCGAFPITSSTTMGGGFNQAVVNGVPNLWGDQLVFVEPESEHSSASFCEGFAASGGRVTNFTSGQGLVLMKEVLYTIAGKRLPAVFNIGARALTSQGLNVHAGHDDMMSVADCGWGMLFRPQRAGGRRFVPDFAPGGGGLLDAVFQRAGRLSHDAHRRKRAADRAGVHEGVTSAGPKRSS